MCCVRVLLSSPEGCSAASYLPRVFCWSVSLTSCVFKSPLALVVAAFHRALPLPSEVSHFVGQWNPWGQPREETRAVGAKESTGVLVFETLSSDFDFTSLLTLILLCPIRHFFLQF